jgi:hypothetical protein
MRVQHNVKLRLTAAGAAKITVSSRPPAQLGALLQQVGDDMFLCVRFPARPRARHAELAGDVTISMAPRFVAAAALAALTPANATTS